MRGALTEETVAMTGATPAATSGIATPDPWQDLIARLRGEGRRLVDDDVIHHLQTWEPETLPVEIRNIEREGIREVLTSAPVSSVMRCVFNDYVQHGARFVFTVRGRPNLSLCPDDVW